MAQSDPLNSDHQTLHKAQVYDQIEPRAHPSRVECYQQRPDLTKEMTVMKANSVGL